MNIFDFLILIPIAVGLVYGIFKGFVKEVVSFAAVVLAIIAAEMFSGIVAPFVGDFLHFSEKMSKTSAYILIFILTIIVALLLSNLTDKLLKNIHLGWLNAILGGTFGALKIALIVSVLMNVFDALDSKFDFANPEKKEASLSYYPILKLAPALWKNAKETYEANKNKHSDSEQNSQDDSGS